MIERQTIDGRNADVAYLTSTFESCTADQAELVKVIFDDGQTMFLVPPDEAKKYSDDEPRDEEGKWTTSGGTYSRNADKQWVHSEHGLAPAHVQERMKALGIPPAWQEVRLNPDPRGELQAQGKDVKGRTQSIYSDAHNEASAAAKFARLRDFNEVVPKVRETALRDMQDKHSPNRDTAAALYLIDQTGFRVGSDTDTGADKQAYGATTLKAEHVTIDGSKITFSFTGKKGVEINKTISNSNLARFLGPRVRAGGDLFDTTDGKLRSYLKAAAGDSQFKVKDYRTWHGTAMAIATMKGMGVPSTKTEYKRMRNAVGDAVAAHLGNTRSVALSAYINPTVFSKWDARMARMK